jgi:hypothetical protein
MANTVYAEIILAAIATVNVHAKAGANDAQRREALAKLYDVVVTLPELRDCEKALSPEGVDRLMRQALTESY